MSIGMEHEQTPGKTYKHYRKTAIKDVRRPGRCKVLHYKVLEYGTKQHKSWMLVECPFCKTKLEFDLFGGGKAGNASKRCTNETCLALLIDDGKAYKIKLQPNMRLHGKETSFLFPAGIPVDPVFKRFVTLVHENLAKPEDKRKTITEIACEVTGESLEKYRAKSKRWKEKSVTGRLIRKLSHARERGTVNIPNYEEYRNAWIRQLGRRAKGRKSKRTTTANARRKSSKARK